MKAKFILWVLACILLANAPQTASAQVDVTQVLADTKTYMFNDGKNNVKTYVSEQLQSQTSCCGDESLYLEVRIDPSGYAKEVKVLTGKNECLKKSAMDIVKNIKWNTADLKGPKTVYFEVKPSISCDGRNNNYSPIALTNNPLLSGGAAPADATMVASETGAQPVAAVAPQPVSVTPTAPTQIVPPAPQPQVAPTTTEPAMATAPTQPQVVPSQPAPSTATTPSAPAPVAQPKKSKEETQREIEQLQSQLAEMQREKERQATARYEQELKAAEAKRQQEAANAPAESRTIASAQKAPTSPEDEALRRRAEQERKREELAARNAPKKPKQEEDPYGYGKSYDYDAPAPADDQRGGATAKHGNKAPGDTAKTKSDPAISEQIALERRIKELEVKIKEDELRNQKDAAERVKLYQEIETTRRKQHELEEIEARKKEQAELERLANEKKLADERRKQNEESIQRIMKEITLLQEEISKKTQEAEKAKADAMALDSKRMEKEQQIQLDRQIRAANIAPVQPVAGIAMAPVQMPAKGDTSKMAMLLYQVQMLTQTVNSLQTRLSMMGGTSANVGMSSSTGRGMDNTDPRNTVRNGNKGSVNSPAIIGSNQARTAASDESWKKVDYAYVKSTEDGMANKEMIEKSIAENKRLSGTAAPKAGSTGAAGNTPATMDHANMHKNMAGPAVTQPQYIEGEQAMKDQVRNQLRMSGVCGLAQAAFEVTVTPRGDVVAYRILAANTQQVYSLLPGILGGLKFKSTNARFNQTTYLEFKTDIRCDEQPSGGQLDQVPNYIETTTKK